MNLTPNQQRRAEQRERHRRLLSPALAVTQYKPPPFPAAEVDALAEDLVRTAIDTELADTDLHQTLEHYAIQAAAKRAIDALGGPDALGPFTRAADVIQRARASAPRAVALNSELTTIMNLMLLADHLAEDRKAPPAKPATVHSPSTAPRRLR
ncbi:MAG: hypothetical protein Q8M22_10360 [Actinomycetota bacterium]|nr:hypothetical protein [Actinomycetota bacterium]